MMEVYKIPDGEEKVDREFFPVLAKWMISRFSRDKRKYSFTPSP